LFNFSSRSRLGSKNPSLAHVFHQVEAIARGLTQVEDQRQKAISGQKLVSLTTSSLAIVTMHVLAIIPIYVNKLEPAAIDEYPNYIWVYVHSLSIVFHCHGCPVCHQKSTVEVITLQKCIIRNFPVGQI
jgi:hypothetical protein